jgi:tRNA-splicing ligase RtcB (3'-phosphate/5'-hydroxy nucleic acid ligase)
MSKLKLKGKELRAIGFPEGPVISIAMNIMEKNFKHKDKAEALQLLRAILAEPKKFFEHEVFGKIAEPLLPKEVIEDFEIPLKNVSVDFNIFGRDYIEAGALDQMNYATKLPIAVAGALMPDAHQGYGLPIGGVLATENAVIPYGVGVDIGCRMCLSIFDSNPDELAEKENYYKRELLENTLFGAGKEF